MSAPVQPDENLDQLWANLPTELKVYVLSFLPPDDLARVRQASRQTQQVADAAAWQQVQPRYNRLVALNDALAAWLAVAAADDDSMVIDETDLTNPANRKKVQDIHAEIWDIIAIVAAYLGRNDNNLSIFDGHSVYGPLADAYRVAAELHERYLAHDLDS